MVCVDGHRKSFVSVLENFQAKNLLAICLGVYTVGCVNSMKAKFFRHVAMNSHIKSVRFTTKIRKQGIYGHAFLTLVIIPQCHSFVILVIKPPFYLQTVLLLNIYLCTHTQLGGISHVTILPPAQITSLFSSCVRGL